MTNQPDSSPLSDAGTPRNAAGHLRRDSVIAALVLAAAGVICFILIAENVLDQHTQPFDESMLQMLRRSDNLAIPIGPGWVAVAARDISALGSLSVLLLVTGGVAGLLTFVRKSSAVWFLLCAVASGCLLITVLKECFGRARPAVVPHLDLATSSSFPSGHSMLAAVVYLTVAAVAVRAFNTHHTKMYVLMVAGAVVVLVGVSRIVLGVHYPTDVLAGWIGGAVWAICCWLVAKRLAKASVPDRPNGG